MDPKKDMEAAKDLLSPFGPSINGRLRELDAHELEREAIELATKKRNQGLTGEEQEILWAIPTHYRKIAGQELVLDLPPQLVS